MKKLLFAIAVLTSSSLCAQVFSAGVLAGAAATQVAGDGLGGYGKIGFSAGVFGRAQLSENVQLEIDLLFVNKGSRRIPNPDIGDFDNRGLLFKYIEIPAIAKYHLEKYSTRLGGGLYAGYELSAEEEFNGNRNDISAAYNDVDVGLVISGEYDFNEHLFAELRFTQSVLPVRDFAGGSNLILIDGRQFHSVLQLMIGYQF